jgi:hypothetical protein
VVIAERWRPHTDGKGVTLSFAGEFNEVVGLLKRRVGLLCGTEVYMDMEITSALHFGHDSLFIREWEVGFLDKRKTSPE